MAGAAIGALLGFGLSGALAAAGITAIFGMSVGTLWLLGASLGSLFDVPDLDLGSTTPNYSFGPLSNTKSQLLPIPLVYGRCRVAGNIFLQQFDTDERKTMDMMIGLSAGPINKVVSVYADEHILYDEAMNTYTYWIWKMVRARGEEGTYTTVGEWVQVEYSVYLAYEGRKEIRDIDWGVVTVKILEGCSCNVYTGTATQNADSREPDGNTYPNLAYVALTLKAQEGLSGNPVITSIIEGRKVWTPSGVRFTRNPAWIIYDVLTDAENGIGIPAAYIDLDSFETAAAYCDELVHGDPRYTLDYIIDTQRPAVDHLAAMLACFGGYFILRDKIELHIERSGTVYKELNPDNFVKGSFSWWQKSNDDSPNRITIEWIDPDNHYEQTAAVFEWQEDIIARGLYEKSVSLLGITRSTQVGRMGKYMLETAKLVQNFCSFAVSTQDADIEAGEVVSLTYPDFTGWNAKPFRVLSVQDDGQTGNVLITCAEYVASLYDDSQIPVAVPVNPNPPVTTDDVYNLLLEDIGAFNADGTWVPIIKASWQNPSDYTPKEINVRYRYQGTEAWTLALNTTSTLTSANLTNLTTGENVEVWVNCKRPNGTHTPGDVAVIVVGADTTPPSAPTGLSATGWFGNINLNWANPTDPDLSHIEVWENSVDDRDTAVKIAEVKGTSYQRYLGSFVVRYYWVRAVDRTGNISGWNALEGTMGNSDQENHQDFVDLVLQENPYLAEVQTDLNTAIVLGDTNIKTIDLPDYEQRLADRINEINVDVHDELAKVSDAVADALGSTYELNKKVRDAGIIVDPDDGTVRIWGLDQANGRISNVEINLNAVESTLASKVTLAQVDERIAGAVFGDAGELLLSGVDARISVVEESLDAVEGTLTEKASVVEVNELGGRIGTAESRLDGHDSAIALLATSQELDAVESRVTTAELNIDALEGSITQTVIGSVTATQDEEELLAQGLVDAMLNDREAQADTKSALAMAKSELYAHVNDGLNAEAGQRLLLAAKVDNNQAAIQTEAIARANADSAMASQITTLQGTVGDNTAAIQAEQTARANADEALSSTISTVSATANAKNKTYRQVSAPTSGMTAGDLWFDSDDSNKPYRYSGSAWVATDDTRIAANTAAIQSEATARADADSAIASSVETLQTTVGENTSAIQTEQTARANADSALSNTISTVSAIANAKNKTYRQASAPTTGMTEGDIWFDSDDSNKAYRYSGSSWVATDDTRIAANTAAIQTEQTARADGDSAVASQVTTLQTTTVGGTVTESASAPSSPTAGQVYYNTTSKKYFRWSGSAWVEVKGIEGHSRSAIQIINESVDGIKGKHAVKIDTNGYVTGYELIGTGASSAMVFHVDNFLIGRPGTTTDYPFALGTVTGDDGVPVTRLSLKNAWIQDGAIKNAKILNGTIENAKIKDGTIENAKIANLTVHRIKMASGASAGLSWGSSVFSNTPIAVLSNLGVWVDLSGMSISLSTEEYGRVLLNATIEMFLTRYDPGNGQLVCRLLKNGTVVGYLNSSSYVSNIAFINWVDTTPINGTSVYKIQYHCHLTGGVTASIRTRTMSALVYYR